MNERGPFLHSFGDPVKGDGVVLGCIGAHNQDDISIANICPVIGHGSSAETFRQTGDSGGMSYTGLMLHVHQPESPVHFGQDITLLIVVSRATKMGNGFSAVNQVAVLILLAPVGISGLLNSFCDLIENPVPGLLFPVG